MKPSMLSKLDQLAERLVEVSQLLMQEDVTKDMDNYRKLTRENAELEPLVALYQNYQQAQADIASAQEMLADPEMKEFAQEEINDAKQRMEDLQVDLQKMLLPKDP
ncbi:MAG: PCRF domain-containing protein, partial [Burkholderiales bacterium]|nr:PCRF domain-containing protein [Burkholderiales bacterium]